MKKKLQNENCFNSCSSTNYGSPEIEVDNISVKFSVDVGNGKKQKMSVGKY
jgi:hypothetical protein